MLSADESHHLTALSARLEVETGNLSQGIDLIRRAARQAPDYPPHLYWLCEYLMNGERWLEAIEAADELIAWSERSGNPYFLDDARFRKALCLKALGRYAELPPLIRILPPDIESFTCDRLYSLDDLD